LSRRNLFGPSFAFSPSSLTTVCLIISRADSNQGISSIDIRVETSLREAGEGGITEEPWVSSQPIVLGEESAAIKKKKKGGCCYLTDLMITAFMSA
jgi:hypothetical protein